MQSPVPQGKGEYRKARKAEEESIDSPNDKVLLEKKLGKSGEEQARMKPTIQPSGVKRDKEELKHPTVDKVRSGHFLRN